jgi:hypothetical protein
MTGPIIGTMARNYDSELWPPPECEICRTAAGLPGGLSKLCSEEKHPICRKGRVSYSLKVSRIQGAEDGLDDI